MTKRHNKKRHYQKRKQKTNIKAYAENYYKKQSSTINRLMPVMAAARRLNDRTAQAERDSQSAVHNDNKKGLENEA